MYKTLLIFRENRVVCSPEQFRSYVSTPLFRNSNSLLGMDAFCSKASCRKLPVHSHGSLNHHVFLTEENLSGQALSHEILNILSLFPGQKHCKRGCSCLMLVRQLLSWPTHWGLDQRSQTESTSSYSTAQSKGQTPLLEVVTAHIFPDCRGWDLQRTLTPGLHYLTY